jgi:SAM-dependent methyltransferase
MDRLPFVLPDFTRQMWVGDAARAVWAPRLRRITQAWLEIEWLAVAEGIRACAVTTVSPEGLVEKGATWLARGLHVLALEIQGAAGTYASTPVATELGKPYVYRVVVGRHDALREFHQAWEASDQASIGRLLGYPPCCFAFFRRVWVDEGMIDTTWPMAVATVGAGNGARAVSVQGPPEANILWRWMGVRAVPHLPCRFDCEATVAFGRRLLEVGRAAGYADEVTWLLEILRWPVEWSALHGIAEILTPVLKVSSRTDATATRYVVQRPGDRYPVEGARGLKFPFPVPGGVPYTQSPAFRRALDHAAARVPPTPDWYASDNGFDSVAAMDAAHMPLVAAAARVLGDAGGDVLDLGCGNGALLAKIRAAAPGAVPFGIDRDPTRIAHAREIHPGFADHFRVGDLMDPESAWAAERRYGLILLMPGRLVEAGPDKAAQLRGELARSGSRLLVYAYGDWLTRYGSLRALAEAAGLRMDDTEEHETAGLAEVSSR